MPDTPREVECFLKPGHEGMHFDKALRVYYQTEEELDGV
jgi:hypothetical protein